MARNDQEALELVHALERVSELTGFPCEAVTVAGVLVGVQLKLSAAADVAACPCDSRPLPR